MQPIVWTALAAALLALVVAALTLRSWSSIRRRLFVLQGKAGNADLLEAASAQAEAITTLRSDIRLLTDHIQALYGILQGATQCVWVNRYDAFDDMGGQQSFSAALLDSKGDGVVISCISGRGEARTYAKPIVGQQSDFNLSPEEQEAIAKAMASRVR